MKLIFEECGSKKATIKITMGAGSSVEYKTKWSHGIAHLMEHMAFQGSKTMEPEELMKSVAQLGGSWNAFTSNDTVCFFITIPAEYIYEAAEILSDMLLDRDFDEDLFNKEKLVVLEEERGYRDDVQTKIDEEFSKFLCKGPMTASIIGTEKSIKSISFEELKAFYKEFYKPKNMLISVTGPDDIDCEAIAELFGGNGNRFSIPKTHINEYTSKKRMRMFDDRIEQPTILISYKKPFGMRNKLSLPLALGSRFFSSGMDSRLFQTLRQKHGLCYGVGSYIEHVDSIGWLTIWTKVSAENINKSVRLIDEEIKKLVSDGPTSEEIERARNKYISSWYDQLETSHSLNSVISTRVFCGLPPHERTIKRIKNVKRSEIVKACNNTFKPENRQVFISQSKESYDRVRGK